MVFTKVFSVPLFHRSLQLRPKVYDYQLSGKQRFDANSLEKDVLQTSYLVRLGEINQLGLAYKVFPEAKHSRLAHSLGAACMATLMFDVLMGKHASSLSFSGELVAYCRQWLRLQMLMHDAGHEAGSHLFERAAERKGLTFDHEQATGAALESDEYLSVLRKHRFDTTVTVPALMQDILDQLMDSRIDADKMDYLYRDAYHCGIDSSFDRSRLIDKLELVEENDPRAGRPRLSVAIDVGGVNAFIEFISMRDRMFQSLYYNKNVSIYEFHLERFLADHYDWSSYTGAPAMNDHDLMALLGKFPADIDAQAILRNTPFEFIREVKYDPLLNSERLMLDSFVERFSAENVIMFSSKIKGPDLRKDPFYVVGKQYADKVDVLELAPLLEMIHTRKYARLYVHPDVLEEAQRFGREFSRAG